MMRFARATLMAVLLAALSVYAFDCFAASTPDEAMQCCDSMPCPEHNDDGSQDCCQTMSTSHAVFIQSYSMDSAFHTLVFFAVLPGAHALPGLESPPQIPLAVNSHAPPPSPKATSTLLRI